MSYSPLGLGTNLRELGTIQLNVFLFHNGVFSGKTLRLGDMGKKNFASHDLEAESSIAGSSEAPFRVPGHAEGAERNKAAALAKAPFRIG